MIEASGADINWVNAKNRLNVRCYTNNREMLVCCKIYGTCYTKLLNALNNTFINNLEATFKAEDII